MVAALYVTGPAHATPEALPASNEPALHIALLLPLKSAIFRQAAEAVQQGFMAASIGQQNPLPIRVYSCMDEGKDIVALYQYAVASGARAVVGPLTRHGVTTLAAYPEISIPTLALNIADIQGADKLYFFGLTAEAEARQIAQLAAAASLHKATVIYSGTALSLRLAQAFSEEWKILGGSLTTEILYDNDPAPLADLPVGDGNMIFLAASAEKARLISPYLNPALPVYGTSQLFNGNTDTLTNFDLNNVRFVGMPWLLQPDHPAVMTYQRANPPLEPDMERLYALGIDAYRLLQIMLNNSYSIALPLDGVTGRIDLNSSRQFQRLATPAQFKQGLGIALEESTDLNAPKPSPNGIPATNP